jgi:hypothetical protein
VTARKYIITAEAPAWMDSADAVRLLRIAFKRLLRTFSIRIVEARATDDEEGIDA